MQMENFSAFNCTNLTYSKVYAIIIQIADWLEGGELDDRYSRTQKKGPVLEQTHCLSRHRAGKGDHRYIILIGFNLLPNLSKTL